VNRTAGWVVAAAGAILALVAIWIDSLQGSSYWSDGTTGVFLLIVGGIAALALVAAYAGQSTYGWAFAAGAVLFGYYGFFPVATAFDKWDLLDAGAWLGLAGGAMVMIGAFVAGYLARGGASSTPAGLTPPSLAAALGAVLVFPSIFIDSISGQSYWSFGTLGHSIGIVMLILAIALALVWAANVAGTATRGLDVALSLVLLGLLLVIPVGAAFGDFGSLDTGAWLGLAGGILAAGGTWAARGMEMPHAAASPA